MKFTDSDKMELKQLSDELVRLSKVSNGTNLTLSNLLGDLSVPKINLINKLMGINYLKYGKKDPLINKTEARVFLKKIENQTYLENGKELVLPERYLPNHIYKAFFELNKQMKKDINRTLIVEYGYRAFGYQILLFIHFLVEVYGYDIRKTLRRVALPQYSQHSSSENTAIDFKAYNDPTTEEDIYAFSRTQEYKWLKVNAGKFGFKESYPRNNRVGTMWEPWHWQYIGIMTKASGHLARREREMD